MNRSVIVFIIISIPKNGILQISKATKYVSVKLHSRLTKHKLVTICIAVLSCFRFDFF